MKKKALILGGAGFIGLNIARQLSGGKGYTVTIADNFFRGKQDVSLEELVRKFGVRIVEGDFTDLRSFDLLEKDYDYVYMLASVVGVKYTEEIPDELIRINTLLIINTLDWLKRSKCRKVLFSSTSECYAGTIDRFNYTVPTPEDVPLCIDNIRNPRFTYAVTKLLGESGFLNGARVHGYECTIIRYHNVYGPRMGFKHVIPQVIQRMLTKENPFKIFGSTQTRSFNFVSDAVAGTILAMEREGTNGEIFHIGDDVAEIQIKELVLYIGSVLGFDGNWIDQPAPAGSVSRRCPDISKARKVLGYDPKVTWKEGVGKTVQWYTDYINTGGRIFE